MTPHLRRTLVTLFLLALTFDHELTSVASAAKVTLGDSDQMRRLKGILNDGNHTEKYPDDPVLNHAYDDAKYGYGPAYEAIGPIVFSFTMVISLVLFFPTLRSMVKDTCEGNKAAQEFFPGTHYKTMELEDWTDNMTEYTPVAIKKVDPSKSPHFYVPGNGAIVIPWSDRWLDLQHRYVFGIMVHTELGTLGKCACDDQSSNADNHCSCHGTSHSILVARDCLKYDDSMFRQAVKDQDATEEIIGHGTEGTSMVRLTFMELDDKYQWCPHHMGLVALPIDDGPCKRFFRKEKHMRKSNMDWWYTVPTDEEVEITNIQHHLDVTLDTSQKHDGVGLKHSDDIFPYDKIDYFQKWSPRGFVIAGFILGLHSYYLFRVTTGVYLSMKADEEAGDALNESYRHWDTDAAINSRGSTVEDALGEAAGDAQRVRLHVPFSSWVRINVNTLVKMLIDPFSARSMQMFNPRAVSYHGQDKIDGEHTDLTPWYAVINLIYTGLTVLLFCMGLIESTEIVLRGNNFKQRRVVIPYGYKFLYVLRSVKLLVIYDIIVYLSMVLFVTAKSLDWKFFDALERYSLSLIQVSSILASLLLGNCIIKFIYVDILGWKGSFLIKNDDVEALLFAIIGFIVTNMDMIGASRGGHGWGSACEFAELGYNFRKTLRENPDAIPAGATLELFCAESVLTFEEVFAATLQTKWKDKEISVMHNMNNCHLECTLPGDNGQEKTQSYPIVCADEGLARARWTFTAELEGQKWRMCPPASPRVAPVDPVAPAAAVPPATPATPAAAVLAAPVADAATAAGGGGVQGVTTAV